MKFAIFLLLTLALVSSLLSRADEEVVAHAKCVTGCIDTHMTSMGDCPVREKSTSIYSFNQKGILIIKRQ